MSLQSFCPEAQQFAAKILKHYPKDSKSQQHYQPFLPIHDHRKERQIFDRPTQEKLQTMAMFKQSGNDKYKQKNYEQASYFYNKVIIYSDYTFPQKEDDQKTMDLLVQQANINLAMCQIKLSRFQKVQTHLNQCINGPSNKHKLKGLYWLTKEKIRKNQFDQIQKYLKDMENIGSTDQQQKSDAIKFVKQLEQQAKAKKIKQDKKAKQMFSGLFSK